MRTLQFVGQGGIELEISVLGPLSVKCAGVDATPTAAKPRTVLAMLAMQAGTPVPLKDLTEELWGVAAPSTARTVVQTYIMQLRKGIATALRSAYGDDSDAKRHLLTLPGGYLLVPTEGAVDAWRFERAAQAGHRARESGDHALAATSYAEALACWRGAALVDVQRGCHLDLHVKRLAEARLNVLDCRIDADLRLGRHHELLGELAALVDQHPFHEGLAAHLMLALYRSGRRSQALEVYRHLHDQLAGKTGLEPSPALRRLQRAMLVSGQGAELTESWQAAADTPRPRTGRIPAELAAVAWEAAGFDSTAAKS